MTTNFPSSIDNFTNPTTSDTLASVSHSAQHADVNDAVEAIETALLDGAPLHIDDANERVGIGTATPAYDLHVEGTGGFGAGTAAASIATTDTGNSAATLEMLTGSGSAFDITLFAAGATPANAAYFNNRNNAPMVFMTNDTERLRIEAAGNVGIGDATPSYKLDVNGDINATGDVRVAGNPVGMVLIKTQTIGTAVSSVTVTNAFSATFDDYRVIVSGTYASTAGGQTLRMRFGSGNSTEYWGGGQAVLYSGTVNTWSFYGAAQLDLAYLDTNPSRLSVAFDVITPYSSSSSTAIHSNGTGLLSGIWVNGMYAPSQSVTDLYFFTSSGTITGGTIRVYGYNKG